MGITVQSWVIKGSIAENALFLQNRTDEIGLCLFEWRSCLAYGEAGLPPWLADLPLFWHVHLPLDLPWEAGPYKAAEICNELIEKTAF